MKPLDNNTDPLDRFSVLLHYVVDLLEGFAQNFTELHEFVSKSVENIPPNLMDKEKLCRTLNIAERTLYRIIKEYDIPVHQLGKRNYFYWEEVEKCLSGKNT